MNLLIALFLIMFEACYEGFKLRKWHIVSEIIEFIYLACITFVIFGWYNGYFATTPTNPDFWFVLFGYVLLRYAIFDLIHNMAAGLPLFYIGNTKLFDKIQAKLGAFILVPKILSLLIGITWLCDIRFGILN